MVGLCDYHRALKEINHLPIGIGSPVVGLVEANPEERLVSHQYFRQLSVAIRNALDGSLCDVEDPIDSVVLYRECGHVQVDSAVLGKNCKPDKVGPGRMPGFNLCVFDKAVYPVVDLFAYIFRNIGVIELNDRKVPLCCCPSQILEAKLVSNAAVFGALVPVLPDLPRQLVPGLLLARHFPHVLLEDVRFAAVADNELAQKGLGVDEALLKTFSGLQELQL